MIFNKQNRRFVVKAINNSAFVKAAVVKAIDVVCAALRLDSLNPLSGERLSESGGMPGTPRWVGIVVNINHQCIRYIKDIRG